MQPIIYYYPERLWGMAISHAKGWGRSYENRTYRTENGDTPCIDVKDSQGETLYLLIIDDDLYINCDRSERITFEDRYLLTHNEGEKIIFGINKLHALKQATQYLRENNLTYKKISYMR